MAAVKNTFETMDESGTHRVMYINVETKDHFIFIEHYRADVSEQYEAMGTSDNKGHIVSNQSVQNEILHWEGMKPFHWNTNVDDFF